MLGIEIAESTVGRCMVRRHRPPFQGWTTFLRNHAASIASLDPFVVRRISFKLLYGLVILRHARRRIVAISVTTNPTAEWIAGQVTDAFPWDEAPSHPIRDRDGAFGAAYTHRIRAKGIRDQPAAPRSHLAEWPRRAAHRLDSARISRPPHRGRRSAVAARSEELRFLLQSCQNPSLTGKRCAGFSADQKAGRIAAIPIVDRRGLGRYVGTISTSSP
jgi:hypothetical protein